MKVFCIGRNYVEHAQELQNEVPDAPVVFMKPPTALLKDNRDFYYPNFTNDLHYEGELVLRIAKGGRAIAEKFAASYYDSITCGIDFTARDLQQKQKEKGLPWEIAKGFDHSAVIGTWIPVTEEDKKNPFTFQFLQNDKIVQEGDTSLLLFSFEKIISYISQFFTLQKGDIIFTGTPKGVGKVSIGDTYKAIYKGEERMRCTIK